MAERKAGTTYDSIMRSLKERKFMPVYVLMGDEPYYIDRIANYIADNVLSPEERDFNQTVLFGSDTTAAQVADLARRYPMMAERQVVIVKEAQDIKILDAVDAYLKNPMKSTVLVWCHKNGSLDRRKRASASILAAADKIGVVFESKKLRDRELAPFVISYLREHQTDIDTKSVQMIIDHIGADLNRLVSELDKVLLSLPDNNRNITPDIVERQIGVSKDFNAFELRNAIVQRDVYKANQIIKYFDTNPKAGSLYSLIPMLFNYFQNLMIAYYAPNRNDRGAVTKYLGLPSEWAATDYMNGMRNYTARKVMQIIYKIREIDAKSKGLDNPNTGSGELMQELLFFILH